MSQELIKFDIEVKQITEMTSIKARLPELKKQYADIPSDLSKKDNYDYVKKSLTELRTMRTSFEKSIKAKFKDPINAFKRELDKEYKIVIESLQSIEQPFKDAKQAQDEKKKREEEARIAHLQAKVDELKAYPSKAFGKPSVEISSLIDELSDIDAQKDYYDLTEDACKAKAASLDQLLTMLEEKQNQERAEKERAELEAKLEQERIKREEEARIERERVEAERRAMEEKLQAEREQRVAEEREHQRVAAIETKLQNLRNMPAEFMAKTAAETEQKIADLEGYEIQESVFSERYAEACTAKNQTVEMLRMMLTSKQQQEEAANQARIEQERIEAEQRAQAKAEREEQERQQAEAAQQHTEVSRTEQQLDIEQEIALQTETHESAGFIMNQEAARQHSDVDRELIQITVTEYDRLKKKEFKLDALVALGVDRWDKYSEAIEIYQADVRSYNNQ